jgi:hypothetical protein
MGIKFHCPNGHKLNVKSFLAGKRGICPKCHVRMRIPMESESEVGMQVVASASAKKVLIQSATGNGNGATGGVALLQADEIQTLLNDPERTWHMSAEDGAQFGPASGAEMKVWLADDRVSSNSHVWCDNWDEWRVAGDVFPQLRMENLEPASPAPAAPSDDPFSNINPQYLDNTTADSVIGMPNDNPFSALIQPDLESSRVAASRRSRRDKKPSHGKAILLGLVAITCRALLIFLIAKVF